MRAPLLLLCACMRVCAYRIADGPVRVELQRTLHTNVPGIAFGVSAEAFSNEDDSPVKGRLALLVWSFSPGLPARRATAQASQ